VVNGFHLSESKFACWVVFREGLIFQFHQNGLWVVLYMYFISVSGFQVLPLSINGIKWNGLINFGERGGQHLSQLV